MTDYSDYSDDEILDNDNKRLRSSFDENLPKFNEELLNDEQVKALKLSPDDNNDVKLLQEIAKVREFETNNLPMDMFQEIGNKLETLLDFINYCKGFAKEERCDKILNINSKFNILKIDIIHHFYFIESNSKKYF